MLRSVILACVMLGLLAAQAPTPLPRFDVVSVKVDLPYSAGLRNGTWPKQPGFISPDTWTCARMPVSRIFGIAFDLQPNQIIGMPDWAGDVTVDIQAKLPPGAPRSQLPLMLQAMFADRFQLITHAATQVIEVRHVEVAKGGVKLQPAKQACTDDANVAHMAECCVPPPSIMCASGRAMRGMDCKNLPLPRCGDVSRGTNFKGGLSFSGIGATMADIIRVLNATTSGKPFADHTGLTGRFDFYINVDMPPVDNTKDPSFEMKVDTERAWREQAGLDVNYDKTYKEPYLVLVVDRIARPTGN